MRIKRSPSPATYRCSGIYARLFTTYDATACCDCRDCRDSLVSSTVIGQLHISVWELEPLTGSVTCWSHLSPGETLILYNRGMLACPSRSSLSSLLSYCMYHDCLTENQKWMYHIYMKMCTHYQRFIAVLSGRPPLHPEFFREICVSRLTIEYLFLYIVMYNQLVLIPLRLCVHPFGASSLPEGVCPSARLPSARLPRLPAPETGDIPKPLPTYISYYTSRLSISAH
jgi:hypothetical protein